MSKRIAVVGSGIVAGFATYALTELGHQVMVFSDSGEPTMPPPGAFYLHDMPVRLRYKHSERTHLETVVGDDPKSYTQRMWGEPLGGSSVEALWRETDGGAKPRELLVHDATPELMHDLFEGALWAHPQRLAKEDVLGLLGAYDGVVVTVPISFIKGARPKITMMPVVTVDMNVTKLTNDPYLNSVLCLAGVDGAVRELQDYAFCHDGAYGVTIYSANPEHAWLRATKHGDKAQVELSPAILTERFWDEQLAARHAWTLAVRDDCVMMMNDAVRRVPKIHPLEARRNLTPSPRLLLAGRWATWERHELSHEAHIKARNWAQVALRG